MSSANNNEPERDTLSSRLCPPAHYEAKINPVKELLNLPVLKFGLFEVGGYNWRLRLEPQGVYMSLYLVIDEPCKIGCNEEVLVDYKFFVYDYKRHKYDIFKEKGKELRAFTREKTQWGFSKFLSSDGFKDPQRGYLDHDSCRIGAELLVSKPVRTMATLTIKNPLSVDNTQKIEPNPTIQRFCTSKSSPQYSEAFSHEDRKWKLKVCRQQEKGKDKEWLSVHLEAQYISPGKLLFVSAILSVLNTDRKKNEAHRVEGWLRAGEYTCGEPKFLLWSNLNKGFIQGNELKFAVKILTAVNVTRTDDLVWR